MMSTSVVIAILVCCGCTYSNCGCAFTTSPSSSSSSSRGLSRGSSRRTFLFSTVVDETATMTAAAGDATGGTSSSAVSPAPSSASSPSPAANWSSKQHLYGVDATIRDGEDDGSNSDNSEVHATKTVASFALDADGNERTAAAVSSSSSSAAAALPLPQTYVTCGKCSSLFAIAASDLGDSRYAKGRRVKCSVCDHTWYQSRDRLFDIPISTHDMMLANKDDLDRIKRNIDNGCAPNYMGVYKLYIGNLDFTTTSDQLLHFIESNIQSSPSTTTTTTEEGGGGGSGSKRNKVCDVSLVKGQDGRPRGFAFVSFYDEEDGKKTLISCNGKECNGRELIVKEPNN